MSSDQSSPLLALSAKFDREVQNALAQDPSRPAKVTFFEIWRKLKPEYEAMHQALQQYLSRQLEKSSICATLHGRVKKDDSISKSIDRREEHRGKMYDNPKLILDSVHDLVGFRIIADYPSGLDRSYGLIKKMFSVEGTNTFSSDREVGILWKPRFGAYEGRNFQVRISPDECNAELSMYYGVLFEIQVTSIAESLYNKLAHPLHYKKSSGTLSRQDEMIIDMSHGLSLCYWITIACMEDRLEEDSDTARQQSPFPETVKMIAGHDSEDSLNELNNLVKVTPDIPVITQDRSLGSSKAGASGLKRSAPSEDTISIELLLRSLIDLPRENRSDADIWDGIRDKLGLDEQAYSRFLESFTYDRMNERKNSIQKRHRRTFEWVFSNEDFDPEDFEAEDYSSDDFETETTQIMETVDSERTESRVEVPSLANWLQEDVDCLYWVSGKPGSGKSFFMKFIEKDSRTAAILQRWQPQSRIISHYLWKPGSDDQSSFKGVICSLLHQMLQEEKSIALRLLRQTPTFRYKGDATDWDIEDLKKLLSNVLSRSTHSYFILIDGLDEMSKPHEGMKQVFQFLGGMAKLDRVKLCVSSRPETLFITRFKYQPTLRMQDLTEGDIRRYTVDKLRALDLEFKQEKFYETTYEITTRADGVFIWVYMVLKQITHAVEGFFETWDDILDHVMKLPTDIMNLYRDMLSRLSANNERYIKQAARYFQYVSHMPSVDPPNIAMLSLVADENVLDTLTSPTHTPCAETLADMCEKTEKTLFSISAGLLETTFLIRQYFTSDFRTDSKIESWMIKQVRFIHKTAIDFLEAEEGRNIFGGHSMGPKDMLMIYVKVQIYLFSFTTRTYSPLTTLFQILFGHFEFLLREVSASDRYEVVSLIHACSLNKSRGLMRPPCSVRHEDFFLFIASHFGFYEYAEEYIKSSGTYDIVASAYVMIGASRLYVSDVGYWGPDQQYTLMRDILKHHSRLHERKDSLIQEGTTNAITWAWRCFLLHQHGWCRGWLEQHDGKELFKEVLSLFIKLGVIDEMPRPRYLIARDKKRGFRFLDGVQWEEDEFRYTQPKAHRPGFLTQTLYIEVNDTWLVQQLLGPVRLTKEVEAMVKEDAFMRILLADNGYSLCVDKADFFLIKSNEDTQEPSVHSIRELDSIAKFPHEDPSHLNLKATPLGKFESVIPVLKQIGYDLPDVNKTHICLHEWINVEWFPRTVYEF